MRQKTFTLIELLVVVSIIAILAAMLLPVLRRSRERANRALELSDRRQVMLATMMYAGDFNETLPWRWEGANWSAPHALKDNGGLNLNEIFVTPYIGQGPEVRSELMFCRSSLRDVASMKAGVAPNYSWYPKGSYPSGRNFGTLAYFNLPHSGSWFVPYFNLRTVARGEPHRPVWSCIVMNKGAGGWTSHDRRDIPMPPEGATFVFFDGHARWIPEDELTRWYNWGNYGPWSMPIDGL